MRFLRFLGGTLLFLLTFDLAAQAPAYGRLQISLSGEEFKKLAQAGVSLDHLAYNGKTLEGDFSQWERKQIEKLGLSYKIINADASAWYRMGNKNAASGPTSFYGCDPYGYDPFPVPKNFSLGSMAGFFMYDELLGHLDNMRTKFPNLVTQKSAISTFQTSEGRPLYWLKISDNADTDEDEPEMLYTAVHHAREPASMSQMIFYMYYLLENYEKDPAVKYIVDNTELYFIPCVNPDGYIYNETTQPEGGGLWRKNRRDNGDGTFGVDLNRNYGFSWGKSDGGSSPDPNSDTYRGPSAFSEPETQAIRWFCNQHKFRLAYNFHTSGNLFIHPQENVTMSPEEAGTYEKLSEEFTWHNHFVYGNDMQTVAYSTNGTSDDWMFGDTAGKSRIFAFTPEVGGTSFEDEGWGFWPAQDRIIPICRSTVHMNKAAALSMLQYSPVRVENYSILDSSHTWLKYWLNDLGTDDEDTITLKIYDLDNYLDSLPQKTYSGITFLQSIRDSLPIFLNDSAPESGTLRLVLETGNQNYSITDTLVFHYGKNKTLFSDKASSFDGWGTNRKWDVSSERFYSPPSSFTDVPGSRMESDMASNLQPGQTFNLKGLKHASLRFRASWEMENRFACLMVQARELGGPWQPLCGRFTVPGNKYQGFNLPIYHGHMNPWVAEDMSLDDFLGKTIQVGFFLQTANNAMLHEGFYIDDVEIVGLEGEPISIAESNNLKPGFAIFPNPANTRLTIQLENSSADAQIRITDALGKPILSEGMDAGTRTTHIETGSWKPGMYFVKLETVNGISTRILVKE